MLAACSGVFSIASHTLVKRFFFIALARSTTRGNASIYKVLYVGGMGVCVEDMCGAEGDGQLCRSPGGLGRGLVGGFVAAQVREDRPRGCVVRVGMRSAVGL